MDLSPAERLTLLMLCDVHEKLGINNSFDPKFVADAIHGGHLWALEWEYPSLTERAVPDAVVKKVSDVLDMWDMIELSYEEMSESDRKIVTDDTIVGPHPPKFRGFDGNNETSHMSVARFLVEKMHRWERFRGRDFNSHMATLQSAGRMLSVFEPMRDSLGLDGLPRLTPEQMIQVLREKLHPEYRETQPDGSWKPTADVEARRSAARAAKPT